MGRLYFAAVRFMIAIMLIMAIPHMAHCDDYSAHYGIDIESALGSAVRASDSGTVVSVTPFMRGENQITIRTRTGGECIYVYVKPSVAVGQEVVGGQAIGVTDGSAPTVREIFHYGYRNKPGGLLLDPVAHLPPRTKEQ